MYSGLALHLSQFSAKDWRHGTGTRIGLQNRCTTTVLSRHIGGFPRFLTGYGQSQTRKGRKGGLNMAAREAAQNVRVMFDQAQHIPVFGEDDAFLYAIDRQTYKEVDLLCGVKRVGNGGEVASLCYFIGGEDGPVKIGHSRYPEGRLKDMRGHSPIPLFILATCQGGRETESDYHVRFYEHRLHGEWFERVPEIEAEIARLNKDTPTHDR